MHYQQKKKGGKKEEEKRNTTQTKKRKQTNKQTKQTKTQRALCFSAVKTTDLKIYKVGNGSVTYSGIPTAVIFCTFAADLGTKFGKKVDVLYEAALGGVKSTYFIHPSHGNSANY